jgi:DNA topoisomerase VI subunit B
MTTQNQSLQRETFKTSRLLDFCSQKELIAQTGHAVSAWPVVALKELLDNAIDACEDAGIPPKVAVTVDTSGISVTDNGPGIPPDTVNGVLDFAVRVSSREAYVSPTRGAQGNALKTLVAMPFVLDGEEGHVEIAARGIRHKVALRVDRIRQAPVIDHELQPDQFVKTGTCVRVYWPDSARSLLTDCKDQFLQERTGFTRQPLSVLRNGDGLDSEKTAALLNAMKEHSKPIKPEILGLIGKDHLAARFEALGAEMETFKYRTLRGMDGDIPWIVEAAFAWQPEWQDRRLITGVNWSPAITNPFRELGQFRDSLDSVLEHQHAGRREQILVALHMTCARVEYTDRGKSAVVISGYEDDEAEPEERTVKTNLGREITSAVKAVTKNWTRQRKAEERNRSAALRRTQALIRSESFTVKDAAFQIMAEAYQKASSGGTLPAHARQIMYAARKYIQEQTEKTLDDKYFTQRLLPEYMDQHPEETRNWDVVFDARGHFQEPHTQREIPLGTLEVRSYLSNIPFHKPGDITVDVNGGTYPTLGPRNRFGAILFIEKEGFRPLFRKVKLADRFDIAVMSTKGMSVTASRLLVEKLCSEHNIPLLVVHDFDKAGFSIVGTLQRDTRRYSFTREIEVIDLGLRLEDVNDWELESETVSYQKGDPRPNLRENGATEEEVEFLCGGHADYYSGFRGQRVELNAFSSGDLITFIEEKLQEARVKKIVPDGDVLATAYRRAWEARWLRKRTAEIANMAQAEYEKITVPGTLAKEVRQYLKKHPSHSWQDVVTAKALQRFEKRGGFEKHAESDSASGDKLVLPTGEDPNAPQEVRRP